MQRKKTNRVPGQGSEVEEDWLITYADAITLLMAFFVMILSFSKIDISTFEEVQAAIAKEIGHRDVIQPTSMLSFKLQDAVAEFKMENAVTVDVNDEGVIMELASHAVYGSGSATLKPQAKELLGLIADTIRLPTYRRYNVEVEGHTDDVPINTPQFPSNWELSSSRAINVARFLIDHGVPAKRFKVAGYADVKPKVNNRDYNGDPLPENQAANRRIVIRLYVAPVERTDSVL